MKNIKNAVMNQNPDKKKSWLYLILAIFLVIVIFIALFLYIAMNAKSLPQPDTSTDDNFRQWKMAEKQIKELNELKKDAPVLSKEDLIIQENKLNDIRKASDSASEEDTQKQFEELNNLRN